MTAAEKVTLRAHSKAYRTPRRQPSAEDVTHSEAVLRDPTSNGTDVIYARELLELYRRPKRLANVELQVFRIGDCAIVSLPCEAYADIALEIRERSPIKNLLIATLTNGTVGYVVTEPAFSAGVYESKLAIYNSFLPPSAATEMAERAVQLLQEHTSSV